MQLTPKSLFFLSIWNAIFYSLQLRYSNNGLSVLVRLSFLFIHFFVRCESVLLLYEYQSYESGE